jgi:predicted TIM-barrel fold metal-dependent hydrolase
MIIDSHVHLKHGDAERTEYSPEAIVKIMDEAGIDRSVVFAMSTTTRRSVEMAQEAVAKFPDRLIPYVYALPHYERCVLAEIDHALAKLDFKGVKIHAGECTLAEYVLDPVIELAGEHEVPCLIDCAGDSGAIERMASSFPRTNIIVAHLGRYLCKDPLLIDRFIALAEAHRNIYLDISGVVMPGKIVDAVRHVGSKRVIFGTDGPHKAPDTVTYARTELNKIRNLGLEQADLSSILGEGIALLLGL